jgi:hypothetical protein
MHNDEDQTKMQFTSQGAWMGFVSYLIVAGILAAVYIIK